MGVNSAAIGRIDPEGGEGGQEDADALADVLGAKLFKIRYVENPYPAAKSLI